VVRVGLHESLTVAAQAVGVHAATAYRWLKARDRFDSAKGVEWKLLSSAIDAARGRRELPKADIDEWRRIQGWKYPQFSEGNFGEPKESRLLRREGSALWRLLLEAGSIASVVVGDASPLEFASRVPQISEDCLNALRDGGLLSRPRKARAYTYWLSFDRTQWEALAIARVCTRTRVIGTAKIRFSWLPPMCLRLDLARVWKLYDSVIVPVPSATLTHHRTPLTFPLELQVG